MSRKDQPVELRQLVERLVAEGRYVQAFEELKSTGWIPKGSGHQNTLPSGLHIYYNIDWQRKILTSKGGRYWAFESNDTRYDQPEFLYPTSRQFPFDEVAEQIVRELEKRNWNIPGMEFEFHTYGSGQRKMRNLSVLRGKDFKLRFGRVQRLLPGNKWNDIAALSDIFIPRKELSVFDDESGPTYYVYAGPNWFKDKNRWYSATKVNTKLNNQTRWYLYYKGTDKHPEESGPSYYHPGRRPMYLVANDDLGREYGPKSDEPRFYKTQDVMNELTEWIKENILKAILETPIPETKVELTEPDPIAVPAEFANIPLWTKAEGDDTYRIQEGKRKINDLMPEYRYALMGDQRLLSYSVSNPGKTIPEIAYDGFIWCGVGEVSSKTNADELTIPTWYLGKANGKTILRVKLNRANDVYVTDFGPMEDAKRKFQANPKKTEMSDTEYAQYLRLPGRYIVPLTEYKGDYTHPVFLINRELDFDEVEIVSLPKHKRF